MVVGHGAVILVVLAFLRTCNSSDAASVCVFMESCILPCSFQPGDDAVIHWIPVPGSNPAHTYYHNKDQFANQDQRFRDRTSLFKDQISRGNASLLLTKVEVQDQGRYKCYTSTIRGNKEAFIDLTVENLVHKVHIEQVKDRITCSSEGIYPKPELTWSTNPPSNVTFKNTTTVQQTEQQLYNIDSSLMLSDSIPDWVFNCTISSGGNSRKAAFFQSTSICGLDTETTIPCAPSDSHRTGLVWRFNHSQIILSQTRTDVVYTVSKEWQQHVKDVSKSGSLTLQNLSPNQEGIYTCELSGDEEMYVTNTFLKLESSQGPNNVAAILAGVLVPSVFIILLVMVLIYLYRKGKCQKRKKTEQKNKEDTELGERQTFLKTDDAVNNRTRS